MRKKFLAIIMVLTSIVFALGIAGCKVKKDDSSVPNSSTDSSVLVSSGTSTESVEDTSEETSEETTGDTSDEPSNEPSSAESSKDSSVVSLPNGDLEWDIF